MLVSETSTVWLAGCCCDFHVQGWFLVAFYHPSLYQGGPKCCVNTNLISRRWNKWKKQFIFSCKNDKMGFVFVQIYIIMHFAEKPYVLLIIYRRHGQPASLPFLFSSCFLYDWLWSFFWGKLDSQSVSRRDLGICVPQASQPVEQCSLILREVKEIWFWSVVFYILQRVYSHRGYFNFLKWYSVCKQRIN